MTGSGHRGRPLLVAMVGGALALGGLTAAPPGAGPAPGAVEGAGAVRPVAVQRDLPPRAAASVVPAPRRAVSSSTRPASGRGWEASAPGPGTDSPATDSPATGVVTATNAERARAGCRPLTVDPRLTAAAQDHAEDMAAHDYFSHTGRDGRDFAARIRDAGHPSPGAENIAKGQPDAAAVVAAWMGSAGHRRNILDCALTTIGVGHVAAGDRWVQDFAR